MGGTERGRRHGPARRALLGARGSGTAEDTDWADGPGVLVIRPESISLPEEARQGLPATVTGLRVLGPRRLVTLSAAGIRLHAEAPWGRPLAVGDRIGIVLPLSARAVVARPGGRDDAAQPAVARAAGSSVSAVTVTSGASK